MVMTLNTEVIFLKKKKIPVMWIESEMLPRMSSECSKREMPPLSDLPNFTTASGLGHTDPRLPARGALWYLAESRKTPERTCGWLKTVLNDKSEVWASAPNHRCLDVSSWTSGIYTESSLLQWRPKKYVWVESLWGILQSWRILRCS